MKFISANNWDHGTKAFTPDEWNALSQDEQDSFDDWIWQELPSKEAAIARHEDAMDAMRDDINSGRGMKEVY